MKAAAFVSRRVQSASKVDRRNVLTMDGARDPLYSSFEPTFFPGTLSCFASLFVTAENFCLDTWLSSGEVIGTGERHL